MPRPTDTSSTRRALTKALAVLPLLPHTGAWANEGSIKIGQSTALTGPLADLGQAMQQGARACFHAVNKAGGVNGRTIDLVTMDDGYEVKRAVDNVDKLLADKDLFALFNCMGTAMIEAMLPKVLASGVPFFAPFSGALLARPKARSVMNVRASYPDEAQKLVQHLATLGTKRIAIAYQNNAFGKEVFEGAQLAMKEYKLPETAAVTVESDGSDVESAAAKLVAAKPGAIIVALAGKSTTGFIKATRKLQPSLSLYALSIMGAAATIEALGKDGVGVAISQVVPSPGNRASAVARKFQQAWSDIDTKIEPSHLALEGYINARVFVEVLQRAGRNPTRANFINTAWNLGRLDLGGFDVNFKEPGTSASNYVGLTMVGSNGRFIS